VLVQRSLCKPPRGNFPLVFAVGIGTEMLEIDCHLTNDKQVVVSHDDNLHRTTGQTVLISETDYKDLPPLRTCLNLDFLPGHTTRICEDRRIPLLSEVFEAFPATPINIDIKVDNDDLIRKVNELIVQYQREDFTVWGNRSTVVVNKLYKQNPNIPLLFSLKRVLLVVVLFYTGLLPFIPLRESFYEILMPGIILTQGKFHTQFGWKMKTVFRIADFLLMSRLMFNHFEKRGIQTYIWVLNDEEEFERAFQLGATGVMTDFPTRLTHYLEERGNK